jgi:hypothetical protein
LEKRGDRLQDSNIDFDLHDDRVREKLLNSHPIINKPYIIPTPMMEQVYALIRERIWLRRTGSYMHASPRMGKSICARAIRELIAHEFPAIVLASLTADESKTELSLTKDIATALGLVFSSRPNYKGLLEKVLVFITAEAASLRGNQFVLLVDEMQMLHEKDYKVLLVLHNRLEERGIMMTTIGFAQPEINEQRSALFAIKANNIIARFLSEPIFFSGCTSADNLKAILTGYDDLKFYPANSGWTYTRFFLPKAYEAGFRLGNQAEEIWSELSFACSSLSYESVPMEYLTRTVESILVAGRLQDYREFKLTKELILRAIASSNIAQHVMGMKNAR